MNWEAISAVSELLAALAVIVTIVYLAIQVRQNTNALRSTATQAAHDQTATTYDMLADNPELGLLFSRGLLSPETLSAGETARFFALLHALMFRIQNWHVQTKTDFIDPTLLQSWLKVVRQVSGTPGFQQFWSQRQHIFAPDFVAHLEQTVLTTNADPDYRPLGVSKEDLVT